MPAAVRSVSFNRVLRTVKFPLLLRGQCVWLIFRGFTFSKFHGGYDREGILRSKKSRVIVSCTISKRVLNREWVSKSVIDTMATSQFLIFLLIHVIFDMYYVYYIFPFLFVKNFLNLEAEHTLSWQISLISQKSRRVFTLTKFVISSRESNFSIVDFSKEMPHNPAVLFNRQYYIISMTTIYRECYAKQWCAKVRSFLRSRAESSGSWHRYKYRS